jgi:hypothetical protein
MPKRFRDGGHWTTIRLEKDREITTFPWCYLNCSDIWGEIDSLKRAGDGDGLAVLKTYRKPRGCLKWRAYTPGFSPQQHFEYRRMEELESDRRNFEQKLHNDHKAVLLEVDKRNRTFSWIVGVFAAAEVFAAFAQMAFPNGWPWLQKLFGSLPLPPPMPGF